MPGSGDAQASQKRVKGRPDKESNSQKTSRDRAAQERVERKHNRGGQEVRTGDKTPLSTGREQAHRLRPAGGGGWFDKWRRKDVIQKREPTGVDRDATTSRAEKGGRPDRGRGGRNNLAAQGCRCQQGPGEKVEGGKTASEGRAVEAGRNGRLFGQTVQDRNEGGKLGAKSGAAQYQGGGW